jgi:hypothetical protein
MTITVIMTDMVHSVETETPSLGFENWEYF